MLLKLTQISISQEKDDKEEIIINSDYIVSISSYKKGEKPYTCISTVKCDYYVIEDKNDICGSIMRLQLGSGEFC